MNNQFSAQSLQGALQLTSYLDLQNQKQQYSTSLYSLQNQGGTPAIQGGMPAFQGIPVFQGGTYGMISGSGLHAFIPSGLTTIGMGSISKNQDKKLLQEISKLELELEEKKEERERFYEKMESQKRKYIYLIDELEAEKEKLENDIQEKNQNIYYKKQEIFSQKSKIDKLQKENDIIKEENENLYKETEDLKFKYQIRIKSQSSPNQFDLITNHFEEQIQKLKDELKKTKEELNYKIKQYVDLENETESELKKINKQIEKEHQYFMEGRDEITKLQKTITQKDEKIRQLEQQQMIQLDALKSSNIEKQRYQDQMKQQEFEIMCLRDEIQILTNLIEQLKGLPINTSVSTLNFNLDEKFKQLDNLTKELNQKKKEGNEQMQREFQQNESNRMKQLQILKKKQEEARINYLQKKQKTLEQAGQVFQEAKKQQGQLDVCFIVDVTGSMDSYKAQTKNSVQGSLSIIKQATNRDTNWASVCYQDKAELKSLGKYYEFPFSKDSEALKKWFDTIECDGGGDGPEDIRGAIKQVCQLNWPSKFKIAILITDAPCHGKRYNDGGDDYPDDDIQDAIEELIQNNIILIALNFKAYTTKMYEEIKKIYESKKKQDLFLYQDLQKMDQAQMAILMTKYIGQASQNATQTNKNQTKSKQGPNQIEIQREKEGAMEALCKQGNFYNFEQQPNVKTVQTKFQVLRVEIKQEAFDNNIGNIRNIQCPQDFNCCPEGQWNCIRTEKPFAFGMMKDVFLMKKQNSSSDELYVIKTPIGSKPYQTLNDALKECKSHLICQKLMKQRISSKTKKYQEITVIYSDFLILQESQNSFWIAERFFKGEFVKYNNNYGFINEDTTELNKFAQSFTFYTYFISHFNYMVSDVQGVGNYFTDPAINTIKGDLDDTDMGLEGQQMYLVNYEIKKSILTYDYLNLLDMYG